MAPLQCLIGCEPRAVIAKRRTLLAKLQPDQQEKALFECFREEWAGAGNKPKRILLPVRHLQHWIEHQLMLLLKLAPFSPSPWATSIASTPASSSALAIART